MAKDGILIQESGRDALGRLHKALSKLGYVCEEDAGRSPFYIYRRDRGKGYRLSPLYLSRITIDTCTTGRRLG